jgi:SOS response regulatory protein OraA/RecX
MKEWADRLQELGLPDDARLAELLLERDGPDAGYGEARGAYDLAKANGIPAECVSKVLTYLRRRREEALRSGRRSGG